MFIGKMLQLNCAVLLAVILCKQAHAANFNSNGFVCGPYGFSCEGPTKLRLCDEKNLRGPSFKCPSDSVCNEDSIDVCDNTINYIDPEVKKRLRCHRNERIADPTVPNCKGYILCIPNNNRFQGIKFKCGGDTVFNGFTRTCSSPEKYKCPVVNTTKPSLELFGNQNRRGDMPNNVPKFEPTRDRESNPIECKHYKFTVTDENGPVRAAYFCPSRPVRGENSIRCTVFSSKYCLTLERDDEDQFMQNFGLAYRKPRMQNLEEGTETIKTI
ncbi:unnamed protein product [Chilo suppressalis]|uniref:Chitin-binding type-2 domain-containing protein n=1 Tax=Chilo suppressalis TaxID=168631 RepID=A0ABN8E9M0_CHISP|nr:unnamed protein product [Chilo suppressalis]